MLVYQKKPRRLDVQKYVQKYSLYKKITLAPFSLFLAVALLGTAWAKTAPINPDFIDLQVKEINKKSRIVIICAQECNAGDLTLTPTDDGARAFLHNVGGTLNVDITTYTDNIFVQKLALKEISGGSVLQMVLAGEANAINMTPCSEKRICLDIHHSVQKHVSSMGHPTRKTTADISQEGMLPNSFLEKEAYTYSYLTEKKLRSVAKTYLARNDKNRLLGFLQEYEKAWQDSYAQQLNSVATKPLTPQNCAYQHLILHHDAWNLQAHHYVALCKACIGALDEATIMVVRHLDFSPNDQGLIASQSQIAQLVRQRATQLSPYAVVDHRQATYAPPRQRTHRQFLR